VRCTWDVLHPDEPCVLCSDETAPFVVERILNGPPQAPTDAQGHVEEVERYLAGLEVEETINQLENIDTFVDARVVAEWSPEDRKAVVLWADWQEDRANGVPVPTGDTGEALTAPPRPAVLGKPHIPAEVRDPEAPQVCSICEKPLPKLGDVDRYEITDFVGTDCSGKAPAPEHHYPETGKKKPAKARKAKDAK
jgi:hypothetical protein